MFKNTPTIHCLAISTVVVTHGKIQTSGSQPSLHIRIPRRARTGPDAPVHCLGAAGGGLGATKVEIHLVTPKSVQGLPLEGRAANRKGRERTHQSSVMFYSLSEGGAGEFVTVPTILKLLMYFRLLQKAGGSAISEKPLATAIFSHITLTSPLVF